MSGTNGAAPVSRNWLTRPGIGYQLEIVDKQIRFDLTRVRRDHHETIGLLTVRVMFRGAKVINDNIISSADMNCSSDRARSERTKHLKERARTEDELDWRGLLEEFCLRVLEEEEDHSPEQVLKDVPVTEGEIETFAAGLPILRRHPTIWFGDGGCGKSFLALYAAIDLAQQGRRVLYLDWELAGEDHRRRMQSLLGPVPGNVEHLYYLRCDQPFVRLAGKIRGICERRQITFIVADSVGFACEGAPEAAEAALGYFRALNQIGSLGSLHLAHMNRSEQGDTKPFGSGFWHNSARSTWYLKRTNPDSDTSSLAVAFYHRKANMGALRQAIGMKIDFNGKDVTIQPADVMDYSELAEKTAIHQRMVGLLRSGALTVAQIAEELDAKADTVSKTLRRFPERFVKVADGYGLKSDSF